MAKGSDDEQYATVAEARARLAALTEEELLKLTMAARRRRDLPRAQADELFDEAVRRVLEGFRHWPKHVNFIVFMIHTMRSIASEWRNAGTEELRSGNRLGRDERDASQGGESEIDRIPSGGEGPVGRRNVKDIHARMGEEFPGDRVVIAILNGRYDGLSPEQVQQEFGITLHEYRAAQKRLRRAVLSGKLDDLR